MKRFFGIFTLAALLLNGCAGPRRASDMGSVAAYAAIPGDIPSETYSLKVNGQTIPVVVQEASRPQQSLHYARFGADGPITVEVTVSEDIVRYTLSPQRLGIAASVSGRKLTFTLDAPRRLLVKVNQLAYLAILVDPLEVNPPQLGQPNVVNVMDFVTDNSGAADQTQNIVAAVEYLYATQGKDTLYFPNGVYLHRQIALGGSKPVTVYLESGALLKAYVPETVTDETFVHGNLVITGSNVSIRGRGVLDRQGELYNSRYPYTRFDYWDVMTHYPNPINDHASFSLWITQEGENSASNILVDGLTIRDGRHWTVSGCNYDGVTLRNINIITPLSSQPEWTDGFNFYSGRNLLIEDVFAYMGDDAFASGHNWSYGNRDTENTTVRRYLALSPRANAIRLGFDMAGYTFGPFVFEEIDLVKIGRSADQFLIIHDNDITYTDITLRNSSVEFDGAQFAALFTVKAHITGTLRIENFTAGELLGSTIGGPSAERPLNKLEISGFCIQGNCPSAWEGAKIFTQNITTLSLDAPGE